MNKVRFIALAMEDNKRVCVAAVVAAIICKKNVSAVYDYDTSRYLMFSTNRGANQISVYDYTRGGYIQGSNQQVYDYITGAYVSIQVNEYSFRGYDFERGYYFNGQINNRNITFYDYEFARYYNYSFS